VKRYVDEPGSDRVRTLLQRHRVATSRLSEVEVASALARRSRERTLDRRDLDRALSALRDDIHVIAVVEVVPAITQAAIGLVARHPLRTGDSIQLASCLHLQRQVRDEVHLLAYDERLNTAGRAEGLVLATAG
jgi:predicted nucleic acid-binding protein